MKQGLSLPKRGDFMNLQECYAKLGGNYESVLRRLTSERLVQKFILKFLDDGSYELLLKSLDQGDWEEAFRAAHTIKGMCQNLSFDTLGQSSHELTELLRPCQPVDVTEQLRQVTEDYQKTTEAIREFAAGL